LITLEIRPALLQLQNSFLKSACVLIWRTSNKYRTHEHTFASQSAKQMSKI